MNSVDLNNCVILLDKPIGKTSFDTISDLKRAAGIRKIGHSGTLDKFASGLLVICTGKATRLTRYFLESDKRYTGRIKLGIKTDTCDITGEVTGRSSTEGLTEEQISAAAEEFTGEIVQVPPRYSSLKINGKRASDRVRKGEDVVLKGRNVRVDRFDVTAFDPAEGTVDIAVDCSKGTYIRSLARDIGERLGTGACLSELRRTGSGSFSIERAATVEEVKSFLLSGGDSSFLIEPADALKHMGRVQVSEEGAGKVKHGAPFSRSSVIELEKKGENAFIVQDEYKNLIAIAEIDIDKWQIKYHSVFN